MNVVDKACGKRLPFRNIYGAICSNSSFAPTWMNMAARRSVVDYALARNATLASVHSGRTTVADVCDAVAAAAA